MKNLVDSIKELQNMFQFLNKNIFHDELPEVVVTVQKSKPTILGYFTLDKIWKDKKKEEVDFYEINISAHSLNRDIVAIAETLCHEMVHLKNKVNGIKDCSGQVHNKKFSIAAAQALLVTEKVPKIGWTTKASEKFTAMITKAVEEKIIDPTNFDLFRSIIPSPPAPKMYRYKCEECGITVQSRKFINLRCIDCKADIPCLNPDEDEDGEA